MFYNNGNRSILNHIIQRAIEMHIIDQINSIVSANQFTFYIIGGIIASLSAGFIMWALYKWTLRFKFFAMIAITGLSVLGLGAILFGDEFSIIRFCIVAVLIGIASHVAMILFMKTMLNPMKQLLKDLDALSQGDFSVDIKTIKTNDELGDITEKLSIMVKEVSVLINAIKNNSFENIEMAENLSILSGQMSENAENTLQKTDTLASSAKDTSVYMMTVASAMAQASSSIGEIASSVEENTVALNEVAKNSAQAGNASDEVAAQAQNTSKKVGELGSAASDISKVTETITEISEQTNLLALNATIEASRAGEAGKGFAVVAGEIKELARQTAEATEEIKGRIEGVQETAAGTIAEIEQISKVIENSNLIVAGIVAAVEQQSVSTSEIARNVSQAFDGIREVNENVGLSQTALEKISAGLSEVSNDAENITSISSQVKDHSGSMSAIADHLRTNVSKFSIRE